MHRNLIATAVLAMTSIGFGQDAAFVGIGVAYERAPNGALAVGGVLPNGPAATAGLAAGDYIIAIDGTDVRQIAEADVPNRIRGPQGSSVKLTVVSPGGQPREVAIARAPIPARMPDPNAGNNAPPPGPVPQQPLPQQPVPQQPGVPQGGLRLRILTISDPRAGNVPAVTVLLPDGWQAQGGPIWMADTSMAACLRLSLADPRTGLTADWLPVQSFIHVPNPMYPMPAWGNYQGRIVLPPVTDPAQAVGTFWPKVLPELANARPVAREDYPGLVQTTLAAMRAGNVPGQHSALACRVRYAYDNNGRPWEADVYFTISYAVGQSGVFWDLTDAFAARGPQGSLDANAVVLRAVRQSTQFTPIWMAQLQVVRDLFRQGQKQILNDQIAMGQKLQEYRDHTAKLAQQISSDRMASADRRAEAFREVLGGVENFNDTYQGQNVYLPAGYKNYWANAKGEYLLSEQAGFDPNAGNTGEWRKLERRDPMAPR